MTAITSHSASRGLDAAIAQLASEGAKVLQRPRPAFNGLMRSAIVEGPDGVELAIVGAG
jgi:hypothetical protein